MSPRQDCDCAQKRIGAGPVVHRCGVVPKTAVAMPASAAAPAAPAAPADGAANARRSAAVIAAADEQRRRFLMPRRPRFCRTALAAQIVAEELAGIKQDPTTTTTATATIPTVPVDDLRRAMAQRRQTRSRMRVVKECEGNLKNYFQRCRCVWCLHVACAAPCSWCTRNLAAFNANRFVLKNEIPTEKRHFPCQVVKRRIDDSATPNKSGAGETGGNDEEQRRASSGYGSMEGKKAGRGVEEEEESSSEEEEDDEEDSSPPIYFAAGADRIQRASGVPAQEEEAADGADDEDGVEDEEEKEEEDTEDDEEKRWEEVMNTYEFLDLSDLYLKDEEAATRARAPPLRSSSSSTEFLRSPDASPSLLGSSPAHAPATAAATTATLVPEKTLPSPASTSRLSPTTSSASRATGFSERVPNRYAFTRSPEDRRKRFLLLGAEGVGKTALATQLAQGGFEPRHLPSFIDFQIKYDFIVKDKKYEIEVADTKGYENQLSLWPHEFVCLLDGILLVYSLDSAESLEFAVDLHRRLDILGFQFVPKYLVATKTDIVAKDIRVTAAEGRRRARGMGVPFFETTAIGSDSVVLLFRSLVADEDADAAAKKTPDAADAGWLNWLQRIRAKLTRSQTAQAM